MRIALMCPIAAAVARKTMNTFAQIEQNVSLPELDLRHGEIYLVLSNDTHPRY